jgi:hypothetical protein
MLVKKGFYMKKVIVFKEYSRIYTYDASTEELLLRACISVLERRYDSPEFRYFAHGRKFVPTQKEQSYLDLTEEQINNLPASLIESVKDARNKISFMVRAIEREQKEASEWQVKLEKFLKLPFEEKLITKDNVVNIDGSQEHMAICLLRKRASYAGEGFEIIELDVAKVK